MNDETAQPVLLELDPGRTLRPAHGQTKLTRKKKKIILEYLAKSWNMTAAATKVGVTRQALDYNIANDDVFANSVQIIKEAYLDKVEDSSFVVACDASPRGYNDRRMLLEAHRRETYGKQVQINASHSIKIDVSIPEMTRILQLQNVAKLTEPPKLPQSFDIEELQPIEK